MSVTKTLEIDGKSVTFKASAAIPRMYRIKFRRDIFQDMQQIMKDLEKAREKAKAAAIAEGREYNDDDGISVSFLDITSLEIFENVAYMMAKYGDPDNVPNSPDEWLDQFETFSIYFIFPQIIDLWGMNNKQLVESKKNFDNVIAK